MKTLKELIVATKCRKGPADGTTKRGAFWFATDPITIRSYGGDGVGESEASRKNKLHLRHYRDGTVAALVNYHSWHQDDGTSDAYRPAAILDCATVEEVVVVLKGMSDDDTAAYSDFNLSGLTTSLMALGLAETVPSPDDEPATQTAGEPVYRFQIYLDSGNGLVLDGCWGSEYARFYFLDEAKQAAEGLARNYPAVDWVICDPDKHEVHRIAATQSAELQT